MTVGAKPCGFCTYLGNRCATPTFPPPRRLLDSFHTNQERSFPQPSPLASFRLILRLEKTRTLSTDQSQVDLRPLDFADRLLRSVPRGQALKHLRIARPQRISIIS